jgi:fibronectin-binding autotransporter adhesin
MKKCTNAWCVVLGYLVVAHVAYANDGQWNVDAVGDWGDPLNWLGGTVAGGADFTATFPNIITGDRTVTIDSPVTIGNIFSNDTSHNIIIGGANPLTLDVSSGTPLLSVANVNRTLQLNADILGDDGVSIGGSGTVFFSGAKSYSGTTVILSGTLHGNNASSFGTSTVIDFVGNGALRVTHSSNPVFPQDININSGVTAQLNAINQFHNFNVAGAIGGSGTLWVTATDNGAGNVTSSSIVNTFTGSIIIGNPTKTGTLNINSLVDSVSPIQLGSTTGAGNLNYGGGAVSPLTLDNRQLVLTGTSGGGSFSNNAPAANTVTINTDLSVATAGSKTFTLGGSNTGANTFAGLIADGPSAVIGFTKVGSGVWNLSNDDNAYTGITDISGTLSVSKLSNGGVNSGIGAGSSSANALLIRNGGVLRYTGSGDSTDRAFTIQGTSAGHSATLNSSGTGAVEFTNNGILTYGTVDQTRTLTLTGTNTDQNVLAALIDNNGSGAVSLTKSGASRWLLSNSDSAYTGVTNISGGVLEVVKLSNGAEPSSIGAASNAPSNLLIGNGLTLRYLGTGDTTDRRFTLNGTTAGNNGIIDASGTGALVFSNALGPAYGSNNQTRFLQLRGTNTDDNTLAANIGNNGTGAVSITKNGTGTWVLTGNSTYTGATTINEGTLRIHGSTFAGGLITVQPGATLGGEGSVGNVSLIGDAILAPGNSAGTFQMASLSLDSTSQLHFELGAPNLGTFPADSDFVNVQTSLVLGGELHLTALPSFGSPLLGDTWVLFEYQPGNLTDLGVSISSTPAGYGFTIDTSSVDGQVLLVTTVVPEPSTFLLFALGMLAVVRRLRPRQA